MAAKKFDKLLSTYQGNAYPAMLDDLAIHLGVSASVLFRLGLGWAPIVQFKKGPNFQGWWVVPERNELGEPKGLSLRSQSDYKVMYPGSKHGLIYEINPDHERGANTGRAGFIRTTEVSVDCPICGKPDGCLVSDEDPADPQAAVCIRTSDGAEKELGFGHLHILKESGRLNKQASILPASDLPVLIVEGMTDVAAAMDMGFVAVGRPSNLAGMDMLANLVRGRSVIIVGENDAVNKLTGKSPGVEGMIAAYQILDDVTSDAVKVLPPPHIKDLRAWTQTGLTAEEFLSYVDTSGEKSDDITVLPDDRMTTVARAFLNEHYRMAGRYTLRAWEDSWYKYTGGKYKMAKLPTIRKPIYDWAYRMSVMKETSTGGSIIKPVNANSSWVRNVIEAMEAEALVQSQSIPCWINGASGPTPTNLITFSNGILDTAAWLSNQDDCLLDPTPDLFTLAAIPYAYDPTATCPQWHRFLMTSLGDEPAKIKLLQEWFGYCLTQDNSHQKFLLMRGPKGAGKSLALHVLKHLVGEGQFASADFNQLTESFGMSSLVGTLVCGLEEAAFTKHTDNMRAMDILRRITGDNDVSINRKFKDYLESVRLFCRFTLTANEFPHMPDHAGAMARRMMVLDFSRTATKPDIHFENKLKAEVDGIANWALKGLRRLRDRGHFTVPDSMTRAMQDWREDATPLACFIEECCRFEDGEAIEKKELFSAFTAWASERGLHQWRMGTFKERFVQTAPPSVSASTSMNGRKRSVFNGVTLAPWAYKQFLGRPVNG